MFVRWGFTSWQHLLSYQDGYWCMTVHTYADSIVLEDQATGTMIRLPTQSDYPDIKVTSKCLSNAERQAR